MAPMKRPGNNLERLQAWQELESVTRSYIPSEPINTRIHELDDALGGSLKRGQIYEIYGAESSGKTTLALFLSRCIQQQGGFCAWIDGDHSLDAHYANFCGVDPNRFWVVEVSTLEQSFDIIERLAICGAIDWLVLDSLTSLPLGLEQSSYLNQDFLEERDEFLRQKLPHFMQILRGTRSTLLIISQTRHRRGHIYQTDQSSTASLALKLRSAARFELTGMGSIIRNRRVVGQRIQIRVVKHYSALNFLTNNVDIMYNLDNNL